MSSASEKISAGEMRSRGTQRIEGELDENIFNIQGKEFCRLTAIYPTANSDSKGSLIWACLCECKTVVYASEDALMSGATQSCGCLAKARGGKLHNE